MLVQIPPAIVTVNKNASENVPVVPVNVVDPFVPPDPAATIVALTTIVSTTIAFAAGEAVPPTSVKMSPGM
jgi:hypothetical protein